MARMYVRRITRSTMYQKAGTVVWKNSSVACGFSSIKIDYSDYPKTLIFYWIQTDGISYI